MVVPRANQLFNIANFSFIAAQIWILIICSDYVFIWILIIVQYEHWSFTILIGCHKCSLIKFLQFNQWVSIGGASIFFILKFRFYLEFMEAWVWLWSTINCHRCGGHLEKRNPESFSYSRPHIFNWHEIDLPSHRF